MQAYKHSHGQVIRVRGDYSEVINLEDLFHEVQVLVRRGQLAANNGAPALAADLRRQITDATRAFNEACIWGLK
jgi:hypothetical protein